MLRRELPISNCSRSGSGAAAGIIAGIAITADKPQRQRKRPMQAGLFVLPSFRGAQSANPESRYELVLFLGSSFRGDPKHRTWNLEIPRCASAHLRFTLRVPRNDAN